MLMVHLSDQHLSPTGFMMFCGSQNVLTGLKESAPLEHIAKGTVMQQSLNLSVNKLREDIVYENTSITNFVFDKLLTERHMSYYPKTDYKQWLKVELVAKMIKYWCVGDNRPINGTYFSFKPTGKRSDYIMP